MSTPPSNAEDSLIIDPKYKVKYYSKVKQGPMQIEGTLIKLKSKKSKKFLTNYVKRYFILDLERLTLSYKTNDKTKLIKNCICLS